MKKSLILILLITLSGHLFAQNETNNSEKKLRLGISLGLNYSNLVFDEANLPKIPDVYESFGFQLGVLFDYQFSKYLWFSPRTNLAFNENGFSYLSNGVFVGYDLMPVTLEIATYMRLQKPTGEVKPYIFVGPNYKQSLVDKENRSSPYRSNTDLAIDFGIGLEKAFKHFNFASELKYSYGLLNLIDDPNLIAPFNLHQISLVFNFSGQL